MTNKELELELRALADKCDESRPQQAIKSVLYGVIGAMAARREEALMNHSAIFAENEIKRLTASRN